jgi:uncharacterized protein (TIGR02217 family)
MSFDEVSFPLNISVGLKRNTNRLNQTSVLSSGFSRSKQTWVDSRKSYDLSIVGKSVNELHTLKSFYLQRKGMLRGFRLKDWSDFKSCDPMQTPSDTDQILGTGDGTTTTFNLRKLYGTYYKRIYKPVSGSVVISLDDVSQASGWSVNTTTGIVTFDTAPSNSVVVKAGFLFDTPVRFDTDYLPITLNTTDIGEVTSIKIVEIKIS